MKRVKANDALATVTSEFTTHLAERLWCLKNNHGEYRAEHKVAKGHLLLVDMMTLQQKEVESLSSVMSLKLAGMFMVISMSFTYSAPTGQVFSDIAAILL